MTTAPNTISLDSVLYANRELERENGNDFKSVFGVSLHRFMDYITGFDLMKFDKEFIGAFDLDGVSIEDVVKEKYGNKGVAIVQRLITHRDGLSVIADGPVDVYAGAKPKFQREGLLALLLQRYPALESAGARWLVDLWELEAAAIQLVMPKNIKQLERRIATTKRRIESTGQRKIRNRAQLFGYVNFKGR